MATRTMNEKCQMALEAEKFIDDTIQEILYAIDKTLIESFQKRKFKQISKNIVTIRMSDLDNGLILDPNNYIPTAQAQYVVDYLQHSINISDMMDRIKKMVDSQYAFKDSKRLRLNIHTVSVLKLYARKKLNMSFDD